MRYFVGLLLGLLLVSSSLAFAQEPILIGGLFAESGKAAFVGTATRLVAEMAIKKINDSGGVLGRPLKMIAYDTESDPNAALRMARQLVEKDKVMAIIGPTDTGSGMAMKKYVEENKVLTIMTVGGDVVIAGGKYGPFVWTFKAPQRSSVAVAKVYEYAQTKGLKNIALLTANDGFGQDGLQHLKALAGKYNLSIVAEETMDPKDTDFSAQAFKLLIAKPQAVVVWTIGPSGAVAAKNFADLPGDKPLVIQCHGQPGPKFVELAGQAAEGALMPGTKLMAVDSLPDSDPQKALIKEFIDAYVKAGYEDKFPLNAHSGYAFDAITLLVEGLKKAGKAEPEAVRNAIEQLKNLPSISGVFNLSPEDHNGLGPDSMLMLEVKKGKFVPVQ